jgi:hypothetical protein
MNFSPGSLDTGSLYASFDAPMTAFDCGQKCAAHNPRGIPFCCDICQAVPAAYHPEWDYLKDRTGIWHIWRGDECIQEPLNPLALQDETPEHMLLLACQGPAHCQRAFRLISCRQFPFFPYITARDRFIGLAYHWDFEPTCWVISNLWAVTEAYRREFIHVYETLFNLWEEDFDSYAITSEDMRAHFAAEKRCIPILHRNGGDYLLNPNTERLRRVETRQFKPFGPYRQEGPSDETD